MKSKTRTKRVDVVLKGKLLEEFEEFCKGLGKTKADVLRSAIVEYLRRQGVKIKVNGGNEKRKTVGCKVSEGVFNALEAFVKVSKKKKGDVIREAISEFVKKGKARQLELVEVKK
jgi:metal-responsive CopG/Arc/MetJ family transcriptional regulator